MKTIILTEKPSVAREFAKALHLSDYQDGYIEGEKYIVTWAIGHLLTPFDPEDYDLNLKKWQMKTLPVIPVEFKYKEVPSTKKQLSQILKLFKRKDINTLVVATDAGREGELIARLILLKAKVKWTSYRFFTSDALTKDVILRELASAKPLKDFDRLYLAGKTRQMADWLVGMNLTRLLSIKLGDLFSVGRVQTAVLNLIVERQEEIDKFIPQDYFELKAQFDFSKSTIEAHWYDPLKKIDERKKEKKNDFENIINKLKGKTALISSKEEVKKTIYPDGLFSLTELQRRANIEFGFSAQKTLDLAQELYEKDKVLSYPRTDSKVMGESSLDLIQGLVKEMQQSYPQYFEKFFKESVSLKNKKVFDDSKLTDHHGLIPLRPYKGSAESPQGKIYYLVLKRFISNFLLPHQYLDLELKIECGKEFFKAKAQSIVEIGFKILEKNEHTTGDKFQQIDRVKSGQEGVFLKGEIENKKTRPPYLYTEASLLYDMTNPERLVSEKELKKIFRTEVGIGTQATRANIIETLLKRNYIKRNQKNLVPESKGVLLIKALNEKKVTSAMTSIEATAKMEMSLHELATQNKGEDFLKNIVHFLEDSIEEWKLVPDQAPVKRDTEKKFDKIKMIGQCPLCKKNIMSFPKSYSCEAWREGCKFTIWKTIAGANITETIAKQILKNGKSEKLSRFKSKAGKDFSASLSMDENGKIVFIF